MTYEDLHNWIINHIKARRNNIIPPREKHIIQEKRASDQIKTSARINGRGFSRVRNGYK